MSTDVAVRESAPMTVRLSTDQLQYIARTEFVPKSMRGNLPAILACVATGRSLGLSDMAALRSINIIDGKASFSAELMVSLVRERGHSIQGNFSGDSCTVEGKRADNGDVMEVTWTREMAQAAGLLGKDNWKKYTPSMLWARAVSQLCRMLFADCFSGVGGTYTGEELEAGVAEDQVAFGDAAEEVAAEQPAAAPPENVAEQVADDNAPEIATEAQQTLMLTKASKAGLDDDARHALIEMVTGQPSSKLVPKAKVNDVLAAIAAVGVPA